MCARAVNMSPMSAQLIEFIARHDHIFVLTGAGVSTASGIPDYRDGAGQWKHQQPIEYRAFVEQLASRQRYWTRSYIGWQRFSHAEPNLAHLSLARLEQLGRTIATVTQNVDGLHQRAGSRKLTELHGSLATVACLDCRASLPRAEMQRRLLEYNAVLADLTAQIRPDGDADLDDFDCSDIEVPACSACGGQLKPEVVFFGENVPVERVRKCFDALKSADAVLVAGSSLMVYSGFRFVREAAALRLPIAAINLGKTRADDLFDLKIDQDCGKALNTVLRQIDPGIAD